MGGAYLLSSQTRELPAAAAQELEQDAYQAQGDGCRHVEQNPVRQPVMPFP